MLTFFISFVITLTSLIVLRPIAIKFKLVDYPNYRKQHSGQIPLIGGICIFIGVCASQIYLNEINQITGIILINALLILILGICDDILNLKAKTKLIIQLILVAVTVYFSGIKIESLGFLLGLQYSLDLGFFSLPFTIIAVVGLINAFNMIDGIDGQAAILIIIAITGIFLFNVHVIAPYLFNLLLAIFAGLIPFLIFNTTSNKKFKIFLGDGGSLFLGFMVAMALIYCTQNLQIFAPSFALWCVLIPVFDLFYVIILRKIENRSVVIANRDHIHHFLQTVNISNIFILILISIVGLVLLLGGFYLENNFSFLSSWIYLILFLIYVITRLAFRPNKKNF